MFCLLLQWDNVTYRHWGGVKEAVSYFTHIFFSFFLAFLQTSYGFSLIKTYILHYFYLILYSRRSDRGEITVIPRFSSGLDLCIFPCFKCIVYQINSFALIAKWFPSIFIILVLFFVLNYGVFHHAHPRLRAPSWILNLKTLAQRFQVYYAQKDMREMWHYSFKRRIKVGLSIMGRISAQFLHNRAFCE